MEEAFTTLIQVASGDLSLEELAARIGGCVGNLDDA